MAKKKAAPKKASASKTAADVKVHSARVIIYNSIGQVQRNKLAQGTEKEIEAIAENLRKTVSKGSRIEIQY